MAETDWSYYEQRLIRIRADLRFELVDDEFYKQLLYHRLTYGLVPRPSTARINEGHDVYVSPDNFMRQLWIGMAYDLGFSVPPKLALPVHLLGNIDIGYVFRDIAKGLSDRDASKSFLVAWDKLGALHERFKLLSMSREASGAVSMQSIAGAMGGSEIQFHWFAHWLNRNSKSLSRSDREPAEQAIQDLCHNIYRGTRPPWHPYPSEWFGRLLAPDPRDKKKIKRYEMLSDRSLRQSEQELELRLRHPTLTPSVLPPLSVDAFP